MRALLLALLLAVTNACSANAGASSCALDPDVQAALPATQQPSLIKRGVNLSRWWEDDRHQYLDADDIAGLRKLGLDFVRLPVSPAWAEMKDDNDRAKELAHMRCDIVALLNHGLRVVVDLHHMGAFQKNLADQQEPMVSRLETIWKNFKPALKGLPPDRILIGVYNEPHIDTKLWWKTQGELVKKLRVIYPENTLVVSSAPDGALWNFTEMKPYEDKNVIYDFHFYEPMALTHHAANWLSTYRPSQRDDHIQYPVQPGTRFEADDEAMREYVRKGWNRDTIAELIDRIAVWSRDNNVRVACLEFGIYRQFVDGRSRANWLGDVRSLLEDADIPWALWEYRGSFGLEQAPGHIDEDVARGLGLMHTSASQ